MQAEHFARLRALYESVVDLDPAARAATLAQQDVPAELAAEVLALCAADDSDAPEALSRARNHLLPGLDSPQPEIGDVLGVWRVVAEIGHGGMGRVYRVERSDGHYTQTAALKFIKGVAADAAVDLFTRERQLLARLSHPRIARLIDGGANTEGRPYLVMEYIDGRPIDVWCAEKQLGQSALLDLFVAACAAVSHAHRQLVVHCDLKPTNILVRETGEPVLLDFGIAQLVDRISDEDSPAAGGSSAGYTPRYASPEQRRGERVGTGSDVYSLGIVLTEMLERAGLLPDRELGAIIAMATREQPSARYVSVDALCDDIRRLQRHYPLQALPASASYRSGKFLRRNWAMVAAVAAVIALSTGFTLTVIDERQRALVAEQAALQERDRALLAESQARASEATARETVDFLISVFSGANPDAGSGTVSIATLLDQALLRVDRDLADTPGTQSQMLAALARALFVVGQTDKARQLYTRAIDLERSQGRPLVLAEMLIDNASQHLRTQIANLSNDDLREALALIDTHAAADSTLAIDLRIAAASILGERHPVDATAVFATALQSTRLLRPDSLKLAEALGVFGWHLRRVGDYEQAIALMQESVALRRRLQGDAHEEYSGAVEVLANTLSLARRFDESAPLFAEAMALQRREGRLDSVRGAWSLAQYATMLSNAGRPLEAMALYDEIFAIADRKLAADDGARVVWSHNFAETLRMAGDVSRATAVMAPTIDAVRTLWGSSEPDTGYFLLNYGRILDRGRCDAAAGSVFEEALSILQAGRAEDHADLIDGRVERARWLLSCGRHDEAAALLALAAPHRGTLRPLPALRLAQTEALLRLLRDGDEPAMRDAEQLAQATYAAGDPRASIAMLPRARWLAAQGRRDEAATLAAAALQGAAPRMVPTAPVLAELQALRDAR